MTDATNAAPVTIRAAGPEDAVALAEVHVASWLETYRGLMPDAVLAGLSVSGRADRWRSILATPGVLGGAIVFVAERDGEAVGFASGGEQRTPGLRDQGFTAEISAVYLLRAAQRGGAGTALMARLALAAKGRGHRAASLWVLRDNAPARGFYERLGAEVVGEKEERREDAVLVEVAYGWRDLDRLVASARAGGPTDFG